MQRTPLFDEHQTRHAKVVDFHGWALPIQFSGIVQEHLHTRAHTGVFDCSHMPVFLIDAAPAIARLDRALCANIRELAPGRCRYGAFLNDAGGIIDDAIVLRLDTQEYCLVTNAGPRAEIAEILGAGTSGVIMVSDGAKLDVQGPTSREALLALGISAVESLRYWQGARGSWEGHPLVITRGGYTGELGYEIFLPAEAAPALWRQLLALPEVLPCGLGARDTLRTEMGYPLHGADLSPETTALEAGMDRFIDWRKEFVGKVALLQQRDSGDYRRFVSLVSASRQAPRADFELRADAVPVGRVTSGTFGPSVGAGIGLGYVQASLARPGQTLLAGPRGIEVTVTTSPMYSNGTCKMDV